MIHIAMSLKVWIFVAQFCSIFSVIWGIYNICNIWELVPALVFRPRQKLF